MDYEPTRSQKLAAAGFTPRKRGLSAGHLMPEDDENSVYKASEASLPTRHEYGVPCKHCGAKRNELHSVTCPYGASPTRIDREETKRKIAELNQLRDSHPEHFDLIFYQVNALIDQLEADEGLE